MRGSRSVAMLLALVLVATACGAAGGADRLPEITLQTLDGGGTVSLESFLGRPVLLTFWASWCGPCRQELPELSKLYNELAGKGFVLLTVNLDSFPQLANRFMEQNRLSLPVYRMTQKDLAELGVNALPTNVLLDTQGRIAQVYAGFEPAFVADIRSRVLDMVGSPPDQQDS